MTNASTQTATTLIFVDASLPDLATLRAGFPSYAEVHLLPAGRDGMQCMADALLGRSGIESLHLICHGAPGALQVGAITLNSLSLPRYANVLDIISDAMVEDGEWLIYGCEVARGADGQRFVRALRLMTGLQVAAATHKVGAAESGSDWNLDYPPATTHVQLSVPGWNHALNTAPTLDISKSPAFAAIAAGIGAPVNNSTANSVLVSSLIDSGGSLSNFTDTNSDSPGIAITGVNANGSLWYSTNGGANWTQVNTTLMDNQALLLHADANTRLYFQPASNYGGGTLSDAITFKAWDRTGGSNNGDIASTTAGVVGFTSDNTTKLVANGAYLYSFDGMTSGTFQVINKSNPTNLVPTPVSGVEGIPNDMVVNSGFLYIAAGVLNIFNVSAPGAPVEVYGSTTGAGSSLAPWSLSAIAVNGNVVYGAENSKIYVINVTDKAAPVTLSFENAGGLVSDMVISGNYLYVAAGTDGLRVFDITTPTTPVAAGFFDTAGEAKGVTVVGNYAYVADGTNGLRIIDISNPGNPTELGGYDTDGDATSVHIVGNIAYVADGLGGMGLEMIDISNPASPTRIGPVPTDGKVSDVLVDSGVVYLAVADGSERGVRAITFPDAFSTASDIAAQSVSPTVSIQTAFNQPEGTGGNREITISLSAVISQDVTVQYATANGTATAGVDYTATSGTATIAANSNATTILLPFLHDTLDEDNETFTFTLSNPTGAMLGNAVSTVTILDNDEAPTVSIANASLAEGRSGSANMSLTVTLSAASGKTISVNYATSNGTATAGSDYTTTTGTLTFNPGETSKTIDVPVAGDTTVETSKTFTVTLSNPSNATLATASATGTITNDDFATPYHGAVATGTSFYRPYTPFDNGGSDSVAVYSAADILAQTSPHVQTSPTPYNYTAVAFDPSVTGTYDIKVSNANFAPAQYDQSDTFLAVYENTFDPTAPLTNLLWVNDDTVDLTDYKSSIPGITLDANKTYIFVMTTYDAGSAGTYSFAVAGPASGTFTSVLPQVDLNGTTAAIDAAATYTVGGTAVAFSSGATNLADADSNDFKSLTVSIDSTTVKAGDTLVIGATSIAINTTAPTGTVTVGGIAYDYAVADDAGGIRAITFTSQNGSGADAPSLIANYEALLDALTFATTDVTSASREFFISVKDTNNNDAETKAKLTVTILTGPTLTTVGTLTGGNEDTTHSIAFADLITAGDEGTTPAVTAFVVKAVSSGSLKIGANANDATPWNATTNAVIDNTKNAYWTPAQNANGTLGAFTVVAKDANAVESTTPVTVNVAVTSVNNAPTVTSTAVTSATEDSAYTYNLTATDVDTALLTWSVKSGSTLPDGLSLTTGFGTPTTIGASFSGVSYGMQVAADGSIYATAYLQISGSNSYALTKTLLDGTRTVVANFGSTNEVMDMVQDGSFAYVAVKSYTSGSNGKIVKVDLSNGNTSDLATGLVYPRGISLYNGDLYIADGGSKILKVAATGGALTTLVASGAPGMDVEVNASGIYSSDWNTKLIKYDLNGANSVAILDSTVVNGSNVSAIKGLAFNADGKLYFYASDGIWQLKSDNSVVKLGTADSSTADLSFDADGNLFTSGFSLAKYATAYSLSGTPTVPGTYTIDLQVSDGIATAVDHSYTLTVANVNDAPTITNAHAYSLTGITEDETSAAVTVSTILSGASWADVDASPSKGIAIYGTSGGGTWKYSTDGTNWSDVGAVSETSALLLSDTTQLKYIPGNLGETATFSYRAWDQTSGTAGSNVSLSSNGGTTAFSAQSASTSIAVTSVNDVPVVTSTAVTSATEDSAYTYNLTATDVDTALLTWSVKSGSTLPDGLSLTTGFGTPTTIGASFSGVSYGMQVAADGSIYATAYLQISGSNSYALTKTLLDGTRTVVANFGSTNEVQTS